MQKNISPVGKNMLRMTLVVIALLILVVIVSWHARR
jgi:preprotein translocase subunit SecE